MTKITKKNRMKRKKRIMMIIILMNKTPVITKITMTTLRIVIQSIPVVKIIKQIAAVSQLKKTLQIRNA